MTLKERQEKNKQLQTSLADATAAIERAKKLADELDVSFEFIGRTYQPLKVVTQGGHFDNEVKPPAVEESWDASDDWKTSGWPNC